MANFDRQLSRRGLEELYRLASSDHDNWWRELLSLWAPNGHPGELRLAIRNGSLNFYSNGQSIGRVSFDIRGSPRLRVHHKYVTGEKRCGSGYVTFNEAGRGAHGAPSTHYEPSMVRTWIANSAFHRGIEKCFVEKAVAESPTVIDLEMGLPANEDQASTLRMDIVALERHAGETRIVFWEAKMIGDARLSSSVGTPEVLQQVQAYKNYLEDPDRGRAVIEAYRRNCHLLLSIHTMAAAITPKPSLDSLVVKAAQPASHLTLEKKPRLLIFDDGKRRRENKWSERLKLLQEADIIVRLAPPAPLRLSPKRY